MDNQSHHQNAKNNQKIKLLLLRETMVLIFAHFGGPARKCAIIYIKEFPHKHGSSASFEWSAIFFTTSLSDSAVILLISPNEP